MSHINEIAVRIAEIQITVEAPGTPRPQIQVAEPYQPSNTSTTNCPFFLNEIHGVSSDIPIASGQQYATENFYMILCIRAKEHNTDLKLSIQEVVSWRDAVYAAFSQRVKLSNPADDDTPGHAHEGLEFVLDARISSWEQIAYLYGDNEYLALKFVLTVNEFYVTTIDK